MDTQKLSLLTRALQVHAWRLQGIAHRPASSGRPGEADLAHSFEQALQEAKAAASGSPFTSSPVAP